MPNRLVVDNGANEARFGIVNGKSLIVPNCTATTRNEGRTLVANDTLKVRNHAQLTYYRTHERGYLNDFETLVNIWDHIFSPKNLDLDPAEHELLLTEPLTTPTVLGSKLDEVLFEHYGFCKVLKPNPAVCALVYDIGYNMKAEAWLKKVPKTFGIVVDSGFSNTSVTPFSAGVCVANAFRRNDVGGKLLTNLLKDLVSFRHWNMLDETFVMEEVKKNVCFVSLNFEADLRLSMLRKSYQNTIWRDYVLPDFHHRMHGHVRPRTQGSESALTAVEATNKQVAAPATKKTRGEEQVLRINNERMSVPETLFRPQDIGISQAGVSEVIAQSLAACDTTSARLMASNIILTGGNSMLPNYRERVEMELRSLIPINFPMKVRVLQDPLQGVFQGGLLLGRQDTIFDTLAVTKLEYEEYGSSIFQSKTFGLESLAAQDSQTIK